MYADDLLEMLAMCHVTDWEPEELRRVCADPVFRLIASYCDGGRDPARFDADELGLDPEDD